MRPRDGRNLRLTWVSREDFSLVFGQNGQKLNPTATLTTPNMRNDLTPERWIRHSKALLLNLGLEILDGQVLPEEITGNQAVVMLKVYLSTTIGDQAQRERYRLLRVNGQWLIDDVKVLEEEYLGKVR